LLSLFFFFGSFLFLHKRRLLLHLEWWLSCFFKFIE